MNPELIALGISALLAASAAWFAVRLFRRDAAWPAAGLVVVATALGLLTLLRRRGRGRWRR